MTLEKPNLLTLDPDSRGNIPLLLARLQKCAEERDREAAHGWADNALLQFIGRHSVVKAFEEQVMWYA